MLTALEKLGREIRNGQATEQVSAARELELIEEVQNGSTEAFEELCRGYAQGLSGCLRAFQSSSDMSVDDALSEVLVGFWELVSNYDLEGSREYRLAYQIKTLKYRISAALDQQRITAQGGLSTRTLSRYRALYRMYDGNLMEMYKNVKDVGLKASTMMDIHAVLNFESLSVEIEEGAKEIDPYGPGERDEDLVALAFAAIADDKRSTDVIWHTYNFDAPELTRKRTDGDVAEILDLTRSVVQRARAGALAQMREVLLGGGSDYAVSAA